MNRILSIVNALFSPQTYTLRNYAALLLVLFSIQYIPIESRDGVSLVKVAASVSSLFVLMFFSLKVTKAMLLFIAYYLLVLIAAVSHPATLRWSSVIYLGSFLVLYTAYYNLINVEQVFSLNFFIRLLKGLIMAYFIVLVIQQVFLLAGFSTMPLLNLHDLLDRGIGANSLSYEPSSAARIMGVAFLCLLRMFEVKYGRILSVSEIYHEAKWPVIGFLWSMLTMGSGTAYVILFILLLYFIKRKYIATLIPSLVVLAVLINYIDFKPLNRAIDAVDSFLSMDTELAKETDTSAATRINPLVNTFTKLDLSDSSVWFGHGVDYGTLTPEHKNNRFVGGIDDYGFVSFIVMQIFIFSCVIKRFFSLETIFWIFIFGFAFSNIPYTWGAMMMLGAVRYFQTQQQNGLLYPAEEPEVPFVDPDNDASD